MNATLPASLPTTVQEVLGTFVESARSAFGEDLHSVVLFGSAVEGRLRPLSDVNVLIVLASFDPAKADHLRDSLRKAHAAIRLSAMFLLEAELQPAIEAFAVKFGDIARRHLILHGRDPFSGVTVPRAAAVARLKQVLLNLTLRMRETYVSRSLREEQIAAAIADNAGPLRACAATLLELQGSPVGSPKEALQKVAGTLLPEAAAAALMDKITEARADGALPHGTAGKTFCELTDLAHRIWVAADKL